MKDGKKVVITYGTFDLFHKGHYNILKRAKEYGDYLIVGVTGENYDIGRGKLSVHDSIAERINNVKDTGFVDEVIVEEYLGQKIKDIIRYNVDVFVIGDDWKGKFDHIAEYCELVYLPRTKDISSTQLRAENDDKVHIGIITDLGDDNQLAGEVKFISGYSLDAVYSDKKDMAADMAAANPELTVMESEEKLIESSDVVFVHTGIENRFGHVEKALKAGKHVICDIPYSLENEKQEYLTKMAEEKGLILLSNLKFFSTQIFVQLLWHIQSGLVGDIIKVDCSISKNNPKLGQMIYELACMALCMVIKLMGDGYTDEKYDIVSEDGEMEFASVTLQYPRGKAVIDIGNKIRTENKIDIIGSKGSIHMGDNWWRCNEFTYVGLDLAEPKTYSMNFTGNGFRFLIKDLNELIRYGKSNLDLFSNEELNKTLKILEALKLEGSR